MKRKILTLCMLMALAISTVGCSSKNTNSNPTDDELADAKTICGVVREVDEDSLRIQLCGSSFRGRKGYGYITVENKYDPFNIGDSVILYYTGEIKFEKIDEYFEMYNVEVCNVDKYVNDGVFQANISLYMVVDENGEEYPAGDPRGGVNYFIRATEDEPEWEFDATYIDGEDNIERDIQDIWGEFTITYDIETMEVISIIQSK